MRTNCGILAADVLPRTRIITLNLGSQSIELADFRAQPPGGLTLCGYRSRELLADSTREATRSTQVVAVLREMMGELQIKAGPVYYTVAEESVFTRFVKLPPIAAGLGVLRAEPLAARP